LCPHWLTFCQSCVVKNLLFLCPHWHEFCQNCVMKNLLLCAHIGWCFAKIVRWKTCYFVPTLIDVLPKFCGEKLVSLCPHWMMFCQNFVVKNLLVCAHIGWCFAKILWWKTCYFVPTLIDVLPKKLWGEKLVILWPHWLTFCQKNCGEKLVILPFTKQMSERWSELAICLIKPIKVPMTTKNGRMTNKFAKRKYASDLA